MYKRFLSLIFTCIIVFSMQMKTVLFEEIDVQNAEPERSNVDDSESLLINVVSDVNKTLTNLYNHVTSNNLTVENKNETANETRKLVKCKEIIYNTTDEDFEPSVEILNGTSLTKLLTINPDITARDVEANCVLVMFHARACPFSTHAAPHFNALARAYPTVKMVALDALKYHSIIAQNGIVGVPTLQMFHNGRSVGKFNGTEYNLHSFSKFVNAITGLQPGTLLVTYKDFQGPVSSIMVEETDYFLVLSWIFIIVCATYYFVESPWCKMIVEMIKNNWRESEAQHEHAD